MIIVMKWVTVVAYLGTAVACVLHAKKPKQLDPDRPHRKFWWSAAISMFLLGLNKQQDMLGWLTQTMRESAWRENWFWAREPVQLLFITAVIVAVPILFLVLVWLLRPARWEHWATLLGIVYLVGFAFVRASSLHAIDLFLYWPVAGIQLNWVFELGGIAVVTFTTLFARSTTS